MSNKIRTYLQLTAVAVMAAAFLSGCTIVNVTKTGKGFYPATSPAMVDIKGTVPREDFEELGMVSGNIFGPPETGYNEIRKKAAAIGADAVIISNQTPIGSRTIISGVAIKFKKPIAAQ
jgi:hypothetical protein